MNNINKWEDILAYRNIWNRPNVNINANRFLSTHLDKSFFAMDPIRLKEIRTAKAKAFYNKAKLTEGFKIRTAKEGQKSKARRNEKVWDSYSYIMNLAEVDVQSGVVLNYTEYLNKKTGYKQVQLDNCKTFFVHRLVMMKFLGDFIDPNMEVNHIDGDKTNNCIDNLELLSHADNLKHYFKSPLARSRRRIYLSRVWDILVYKECQPKGFKYINTISKFGVLRPTLNSYGLIFNKSNIESGNKEYLIDYYLDNNYGEGRI